MLGKHLLNHKPGVALRAHHRQINPKGAMLGRQGAVAKRARMADVWRASEMVGQVARGCDVRGGNGRKEAVVGRHGRRLGEKG